jgi:hypothetical protein
MAGRHVGDVNNIDTRAVSTLGKPEPGGESDRGRHLGSDGRQTGADEHERGVGVVGLGDCGHREFADHSWSKNEAMGGAAELEVP